MPEAFTYIHTGISRDLTAFTGNLLSILNDENPDIQWRTEELQRHYVKFRDDLGEEGVVAHLEARMQGHTMALLENDFPYDALMPPGGEMKHAGGGLIHYCLWSTDERLLTPENIDMILDTNFFGYPALVFLHEARHKSIKTLPHVHIIIDLGMDKPNLFQRFFEPEDFMIQ